MDGKNELQVLTELVAELESRTALIRQQVWQMNKLAERIEAKYEDDDTTEALQGKYDKHYTAAASATRALKAVVSAAVEIL